MPRFSGNNFCLGTLGIFHSEKMVFLKFFLTIREGKGPVKIISCYIYIPAGIEPVHPPLTQ